MNLATLVRACIQYRAMGDAVTGQLNDLINGDDISDMNPNAMRMARDWLSAYVPEECEGRDELLDAIGNWLSSEVSQ